MALVKLIDIEKRFGTVVGVARQSLDIADGEFMVFLGPSGCGKTTTMRMIAGLIEPSSGSVFIGEKDVTDAAPKDRDVAMVFQNYGLYPHMSVADNIGYPLKVRGIPKAERRKLIEQTAEKVELGHLLDRRPSALSGGQRQRVALARAIVRRPQVFLMDEPLSNLDAQLRVSMRAEIKHLQRELGITTIYVTHDQIEAMTLADRIAVMKEGVIQQLGSPEQIYNEPSNLFVASFIGSPAMNLVKGELKDGHFVTQGARIAIPGAEEASARQVVLGIRPEDIEITDAENGDIRAPVYTFELTGDAVFATVDLNGTRICARGDRHLRCATGETIGLRLDPAYCHIFDAKSGERAVRRSTAGTAPDNLIRVAPIPA